ncbi:M14 family metallopeptidase [Croceitalea marina]|uniref:M14 family metallopeptidase n=1 Tax=Croceitalea marina TaxID=1775166 RepID=A0ABW5MT92_9FLAO
MKKIVILLYLASLTSISAQTTKFQGQPPIKIVPTTSKPIQKQWKANFKFNSGDVVFSNDFEGARLNGVLQENDSTYTALITSENTPVNTSPWYAFKVWAKKRKRINVVMTYQESAKHRYYPKLSTDGIHWSALDSIDYSEFEKGDKAFGPGSLPIKVNMNLQIGPDTLWVSGQELHNSHHVSHWVDSMAQKAFVAKTTIGKSRQDRDLNLLAIGKEDSKNMLMVISRQHPPEVTGYLAMKSFLETIASDTKLAKKFRRKFVTYVVPLMNPDGVDNGHWRHNAGGVDLNRDWANFNQPETQAVKRFMEEKVEQTQGKFYFGIDFHSTWDDIYYTVDPKLEGNMPNLVTDWLTGMKEEVEGYNPNIRPSDKMRPTTVSRNYFFVEHGAEALVFEIGDNTPREFLKEKTRISANILMQLMLERLK